VSYFVGLSCARWQPTTLLSGDRNITNGTALQNGVLVLTANHPARWTAAIHNRKGNIGLADGSVQQVDDKQLNAAVAASGTNINWLGVP
jgi:prepilin-type processing-associated H-X9-DG protein